jgi:ATP-dependent 26S proteasome regulatory subunit
MFSISHIGKRISLFKKTHLHFQQEQGSYVGEVVKAMDKKKVLVKVHPEGKFVVDIDKNIDMGDITPNCRVALRNDSYTLHKILPNKVDPLVSVTNDTYKCSPDVQCPPRYRSRL